MFENIFETVNSGFAQAIYEDYLRDPASVPPEWRALFENGVRGESPPETNVPPPSATPPSAAATTGLPAGAEVIKGPALRLLQNMKASLAIPTATSFRDVAVDRLWDTRRAINAALAAQGRKVSFTHLIGWAIVLAARQYPSMVHAVIHRDDTPLRLDPDAVHLGLAVDVERKDGSRGLMVPVIKQADAMAFGAFYEEYERLVQGARTSKLMPDAYAGATITLTNPGTIGTVASVPRLMTGQGSIIATGAIRSRGGERWMTLTSTYDHRIIQGAESGFFLQRVDQLLQGADAFYDTVASALDVRITMPAAAPAGTPSTPAAAAATPETLYHVAAAMSLVKAHRTHGYLAAKLDPLGHAPIGDPALDPEPLGLTEAVMRRIPSDALRVYVPGETLWDAFPALRQTYCGSIAYEIEHISNHAERVWLRRVIESGEHRDPLTPDEQRHLLRSLIRTEGLEIFLHRAYLGHKRFGVEGLDMLVPMLHAAVETAGAHGATDVVMGMAHRGRLNVLTHVLGVPYETLLAEFEGGREVEETLAPRGGTGDVKYHHGWRGEWEGPEGRKLTVTLMANPSHLEAVDPAVEGYARAVQTTHAGHPAEHRPEGCLPILIHGDAAFAAQGVVAETLNLANLRGYDTGGTLHIIANNQVGFTTDPEDSRSTDFASDLAKGFDVPIIHVNADDPHACLAAIRLAMMYRKAYRGDCVINLVGYRRHGHNEGDEPRYTQPAMYARIDDHPTAATQYADRLVEAGIVTAAEVQELRDSQATELAAIQDRLRTETEADDSGEEPIRLSGAFRLGDEPTTAVGVDRLRALNEHLLAVPEGFTIHPKLKRQLDRRRGALEGEAAVDWGHAEGLAFGSLLIEGVPLRLTGQDSERGTFAHRHLVLHDPETAAEYAPAQHLPDAQSAFELHNSPLSEFAALGFEYGYATRRPEALVIWEAQFGDFANSAQVIIDQFIVAGLAKWGQTNRLTLLLPHGYEGQGPEHSSARLERWLALGAEGNIRVANCSTPAQYFHLLRRQAHHPDARPLVVMTPKSLLRLPQSASRVAELSEGRFHHVLDDAARVSVPEEVTRLVLCSGKLYYDLVMHPARAETTHVAIGRFEMLYPFPQQPLIELIHRYPNLREVMWAQEEPRNFGARKWVVPQTAEVLPEGVTIHHVSRPERSSPAEGYPAAHKAEQEHIVATALGVASD